MKQIVIILMLANAAVFVFGGLQHVGVAIGSLEEPIIIPASIVELICAAALIWGVFSIWRGSGTAWRAALIGNLVVVGGVAIGMVALAMGAGPRTASNDLYHKIMLALAGASLIILFLPAARAALRRTNAA